MAASPSTGLAQQPGPSRPGIVLLAVCMGMFLIQLDATIVNVALPAIGRGLGSSVSGLQWVADGYTVCLAALLMAAGRFGDLFGHKRIFLIGLAVFALANVWCAVAPSVGMLITARVFQGIGAALELPATLAILTRTYTDPGRRARAIGIWSAVAGISLVAGPLLGGWLVDAEGWRSVFVLNLPFTVVTGVLALVAVREKRPAGSGPRLRALDLPGQVLITAVLVLITVVAIEGRERGWGSPIIIVMSCLAVVSAAAFGALEVRTAEPILPLRFFGNWDFSGSSLAGLVQGFVLFGLLFDFSFYFQSVHGDSAVRAGARFIPLSATFVVLGPLVGRLVGKIGSRWVLTTGLAFLGIGPLLLTRVGAHTGYAFIAVTFVVIGIGFALATTAMVTTAMSSVPPQRAGLASSVSNTSRQTGGVLGVAVLGSLLTAPGAAANASRLLHGLHQGMFAAGITALCGALCVAIALGRARVRPGATPAAAGRHDNPTSETQDAIK